MRKPKRRLVRIGEVKTTKDPKISDGRLYELNPEGYEVPFELQPGTVLEVVSTPEVQK